MPIKTSVELCPEFEHIFFSFFIRVKKMIKKSDAAISQSLHLNLTNKHTLPPTQLEPPYSGLPALLAPTEPNLAF
jgi:hypothetical protein